MHLRRDRRRRRRQSLLWKLNWRLVKSGKAIKLVSKFAVLIRLKVPHKPTSTWESAEARKTKANDAALLNLGRRFQKQKKVTSQRRPRLILRYCFQFHPTASPRRAGGRIQANDKLIPLPFLRIIYVFLRSSPVNCGRNSQRSRIGTLP